MYTQSFVNIKIIIFQSVRKMTEKETGNTKEAVLIILIVSPMVHAEVKSDQHKTQKFYCNTDLKYYYYLMFYSIVGCTIENGQPGNGKVKGTCEEGLLCLENGICAG